MEAIRIFFAFATYKDFKESQMDIKSTFMNGDLEEDVYIEKLEGFYLWEDPNMVFRLKMELYGLKQVPRAWYVGYKSVNQKKVYCFLNQNVSRKCWRSFEWRNLKWYVIL